MHSCPSKLKKQQFKQSSMQQFKQAVSFDLMFKQPFKVQAVHLIV